MPSPEVNKNLQSGLNSNDAHANVLIRDSNPFNVNIDGNKIESNPRSTYDRHESPFFQVDRNPFAVNSFKPLEDLSYRESLLLFVKGLGPKAKMVAARKLQAGGLQDIPGAAPRTASPGLFFRPASLPKITPPPLPPPPPPPQPQLTSEINAGVLHCPKVTTEENVRPVILALEHSQGNHGLESGKSRSKRNCLQSTTSFPQNKSSSDRGFCHSHTLIQKKLRSSPPLPPLPPRAPPAAAPPPPAALAPRFAFDMCFFKDKLDRMIVDGSSGGQKVDNKFGSGFLSWASGKPFLADRRLL